MSLQQGLRNAIDEMLKFFGNPAADAPTALFYESMFFVFTKVSPTNQIAAGNIMEVLQKLLEEYGNAAQSLGLRLQNILQSAKEKELLKSKAVEATLRHGVVERMLVAIRDRERFLLSRPDGMRACSQQRRRIQQEIAKLPGMNRHQLQAAVYHRKTHSHKVVNSLVSLLVEDIGRAVAPGPGRGSLKSFLARKRDCVRSLQDLVRIFEENESLAAEISRDWESARDAMVREKETMLGKLRPEISEKQRKAEQLADSTREVLYYWCGRDLGGGYGDLAARAH